MDLELRCPYCGFEGVISTPDDITQQELKMVKACPCGGVMETVQEAEERRRKSGIKVKTFYTMITKIKADTGESKIYAVKKEGIVFKRCGITLYAYRRECDSGLTPTCYIIDPETGLSIDAVHYPLDVAPRHISRNAISALKQAKADPGNKKYRQQKKTFKEAERVEALEE